MNEYQTDVPPPGLFIKEELEARGLAQRDLAYILGTTEQVVTRLLNGKYGISPEMAKALGQAFDVNPELFVNLQAAYDMAHASEPDPGVARRARLQNVYPIREMINRGWLENTDAALLEVQMARFLKAANSNEIPYIAHAAKKTDSGSDISPLQYAWLCRVLQIAEQMPTTAYSEGALRKSLPRLRALMSEPIEARHVPRMMALARGMRDAQLSACQFASTELIIFGLFCDMRSNMFCESTDRTDRLSTRK
jgi:HTH-type transcriptional regulator/antitoxin HigA